MKPLDVQYVFGVMINLSVICIIFLMSNLLWIFKVIIVHNMAYHVKSSPFIFFSLFYIMKTSDICMR